MTLSGIENPTSNASPSGQSAAKDHDATGDEKSNQQLSLRRAEAVRNWMLQTSDIPATCFAVQGLGESQPAATNDTPQGRAVNRRVEISLVPRSDACQDVK